MLKSDLAKVVEELENGQKDAVVLVWLNAGC